MKKTLIRVVTLVAIVSFLAGCKKSNQDNTPTKPQAEIVEDKYIVKNSRSDYSLVIPKKYKQKELTAAETVANYINKSTGAKLNIIHDNEVISGSHYISIGNTSLFNTEFNGVSMSELDGKISSYFISTKKDNIYIYSNPNERGEATLYGAYDLLHELVNYEYYASDEIYFTKETDINLRNYKNFFIHPTFDGRSIGNFHLMYDQDCCDSHRIINQYRGTEWVSEIYGHSQVTAFVRPQDDYRTYLEKALDNRDKPEWAPIFNEHPDWISAWTKILSEKPTWQTIHDFHPEWFSNPTAEVAETTNNQLCWAAGPELEVYVAQRFIQFFKDYPNATYFMFGQEDNHTAFCKCEKCQKAIADYAVNYAGLQIDFMNHVIAKTDAWLKANEPGRQVRYVVFAYYATKAAPCVKKDNKWVLANDRVMPNDNLYILYAPITCNFAFPLDNNAYNSDTYLELNQWNEVAGGHVMIYLYDVNFRHYFANFYNFSTVKSMYKTCKDLGVSYMYTQGATDTVTTCFLPMREYVESKLMWDIDNSYDELVQDFIKHYYYDASDEIYEYYQTVRDRLAEYHVQNNDGGGIYSTIVNKTIYPYSVLRYFTTLFNEAMEKISHYQVDNPDLYNNLKARIMREYLSVIYLKMTLAKAEVSDQEKEEMKEIFKTYTGYFGIAKTFEGGSVINVDDLFA